MTWTNDESIAWVRGSTVIPLVVWAVLMFYWARKNKSFYRYCTFMVIASMVLLSFEVWRRRMGIGPAYNPNGIWASLVNFFYAFWVWTATIAAGWSLIVALAHSILRFRLSRIRLRRRGSDHVGDDIAAE